MQVAPTRHSASPHAQTSVAAIHSIVVASPTIQPVFNWLVFIIDEWLTRPISGNVNVRPWKDHFQKNEDKVINNGTETEKLSGPDTTSIVSLQAIDQGVTLYASFASSSTPTCSGMVAIEFLLADCSSYAIIDSFGPLGNIKP